jgi:hypothetical protein
MRLLAAAALALAMTFPAIAGPACMFVLPETEVQLKEQGIKYSVLSEEKRALFLADLAAAAEAKGMVHDLTTVTDVLLAIMDGNIYFGLVRDGCLSPPLPLADFLPTDKLSGWTPVGVFA